MAIGVVIGGVFNIIGKTFIFIEQKHDGIRLKACSKVHVLDTLKPQKTKEYLKEELKSVEPVITKKDILLEI